MNKVERLRVAGAVAPHVRRAVDWDRRIAVVDATGKVVGYRTLAGVRKVLLERAKIELDAGDGVRPKRTTCESCGAVLSVSKTGCVPKYCPDGCATKRCAGTDGTPCTAKPSPNAFTPSKIRNRNGAPWRCGSCAARLRAGVENTVAFKARERGIKPTAVRGRLAKGHSIESALEMGPKQLRKAGRGSVRLQCGRFIGYLPPRFQTKSVGTFDTQAEARAALDAKIAELEAGTGPIATSQAATSRSMGLPVSEDF